MIEVRGIRIPLERHRRLDGDPAHEEPLVRERALALLRLDARSLRSGRVLRRSIDARKGRVFLEFTYGIELKDRRKELGLVRSLKNPRVTVRDAAIPIWPDPPAHRPGSRPVVVGAGCAGLFCALGLAHAGLEPLLVERGDDCSRRTEAIRSFFGGGPLDPESNVQFGLGGAGTFSDGKLSTGTKDPSHRLILEAFVAAGAPADILIDAKPHVGSDLLPGIVERLVARIESLGGEVRCRTRLVGLGIGHGRIASVELETEGRTETVPADTAVLATGHSARDVYRLLGDLGVALEPKPFAVGVRIEHLQAEVDRNRYGRWAGHPALGAAPYQAAVKTPGGRRCFTFCMCPGGTVMAATSELEAVVTNGASEHARAAANANAGLLVNVNPEDLASPDVFKGLDLQRAIERNAFQVAGATYAAPAQLVGDFLADRPSSAPGTVIPSYPRGVTWGSIDGLLPAHVTETLREALPLMARKLPFFDNPEAVLTAPETRSSSPVRIPRTDALVHPAVVGLYPVGEGGGWAGGIMSAAADGLRAARAICAALD